MTAGAICFDLDDTLYDYRHYARTGLAAAAERLEAITGRDFHDDLVALYFDREVTEGTFDALLDRHDLDGAGERNGDGDEDGDLVGELVDAFHGATESLPPYPETEAVLSRLEGGYRLGLITDGRGGHAKVGRLGIGGYFDAVLVTPTVDASKHDPTVFERTLSELGVPARETVYVGDDPRVDFRVPNRLGMGTVRIRRGRYADLDPSESVAAPDHEVDRLDELLPLVGVGDGAGDPGRSRGDG